MRSGKYAQQLIDQGLPHVSNLKGSIVAWVHAASATLHSALFRLLGLNKPAVQPCSPVAFTAITAVTILPGVTQHIVLSVLWNTGTAFTSSCIASVKGVISGDVVFVQISD